MTQGQSESKKNESGLETVSDGTRKWTKDDTDIYSVLSSWFDEIEEDFDLVLIQEYFFMSLALLVETFCWSVDDVIINPTITWLDSIQPDEYHNKLSENSIRKVSN